MTLRSLFAELLLGVFIASAAHASTTLTSPRFVVKFSSEGQVASLIKRDDGTELLNLSNPGVGLYLKTRDTAPIRFTKIAVEANRLVASTEAGYPRVTFRISDADRYLAFHIERVEAVPNSSDYSLHFEMNLSDPLRVIELDYMTEANMGANLRVDWRHLWNRHPSNPLGGFALYYPESEQDEDDTLLRIWVGEKLPHPQVSGEWNTDAAQQWVDRWLQMHGDQSRFWIHARDEKELYDAVPYAEKAGTRDIYLFTDVWRGGDTEGFWNVKQLNWGINKKIFPKGEEDLRAFADHLRQRNLNLKLHWISGSIGFKDPKYVGTRPNPHLASWGRGTVIKGFDSQAKTILFRPDPGAQMPFRLPTATWEQHYTHPPALHPWFDFEWVVVGDEIIHVGSFEDTDKPVWRLTNCRRGEFNTEAVAHDEAAPLRGLISAYKAVFVPENDSPLLEEVAAEYAGMLNRCGVSHVEFDGAEIHTYNGRMWGFRKFASLVYQHLDHPVTTYTSSGSPPPCNFEYRLNATKHTWRGRDKGIVPVLLDESYRPASNLLDAHWGLSQMSAHGYSIYNIMKPDPMFGVNARALRIHGLTEELLKTARNWKEVNGLLSADQRERMRKTLYFAPDPCAQAGNHEKSRVIHVLSKHANRFEIHPTQVLCRPGDADTVWHDGQEHGAISPRQFLKPGSDFLRLVNPYKPQAPKVILRCLWGMDYEGPTEGAAVGQGTDVSGADKAFDYAKMALHQIAGSAASTNILVQPVADELRNKSDVSIQADGTGLLLEARNPTDQSIVREDQLPEWSRTLNMTKHRGIGFWVTGDQSGAILTIQIPGGDYVVPIDFVGRRYIEIPNAQVAWSTGYWGWRMGSKRTYYSDVRWLKMGFGILPPKSHPRVRVEGLKALREIATKLRNPVLRIGDASLKVNGVLESSQYLVWDNEDMCEVFDANWHQVGTLPVIRDRFSWPNGEAEFKIDADAGAILPWVEVQLLTRDDPIAVPLTN